MARLATFLVGHNFAVISSFGNIRCVRISGKMSSGDWFIKIIDCFNNGLTKSFVTNADKTRFNSTNKTETSEFGDLEFETIVAIRENATCLGSKSVKEEEEDILANPDEVTSPKRFGMVGWVDEHCALIKSKMLSLTSFILLFIKKPLKKKLHMDPFFFNWGILKENLCVLTYLYIYKYACANANGQ